MDIEQLVALMEPQGTGVITNFLPKRLYGLVRPAELVSDDVTRWVVFVY